MASILIVDDDRNVAETYRELLTSVGHEVATSRDGSDVLAKLQQGDFEMLILDVLIPHVNGFTLIEKIREDPNLKSMPVLMISGIYRGRNHRDEMIERFGVLDYLDKPVETDRLLDFAERTFGQTTPQPVLLDRLKIAEKQTNGVTNDSLVDPEARSEKKEVEAESRSQFTTSAFVLQGSIKRNPVPAVLGKLWHQKQSGALLLRRNKVRKIIYLRSGDAYQVKSNLVSECLGNLLVRERLISEEECAASIAEMQKTGKRQGEILVAMRAMTIKNLAFSLELQLEAKLYDPFRWEDGEFRFNTSAKLPDPGPDLEWSGPALITEGIRRTFDETRLRQLMLPVLDVPLEFRGPRFDFGTIGLTSKEHKAVRRLRLPRTTRDLFEYTGLPPPDILRVLYSLIALELVVPAG